MNNIPCKDCITKVICRNELYKELDDYLPCIRLSIDRTIRQKCSLIDKILVENYEKGTYYKMCKRIFEELELLKDGRILSRINELTVWWK